MKGAIHTSSATESAVRPSEPRAGLEPPFGGGPAERRSRRRVMIAALAALAVATAAAAFLLRAGGGGSSPSGSVATVVVTRGDFVRALRLAGVTQAVRSQPIVAPRLAGAQLSTMIVTGMNAAGSSVKIGDVLVEFDPTKVQQDLAQKNLQAEQRKYELGAEQIFFVLEAQTELAQAEQTLVQSEIGYQLAATAVEHETGGLLARYQVQIENLAR